MPWLIHTSVEDRVLPLWGQGLVSCSAGRAVITEDGALRPACWHVSPSLLQKPLLCPISLHLILTGPAVSAPPETFGMLLCSADLILGALNMIKLPDMFLFYSFSAWRLFSRGEATPWGRAAQRSLAAGWATCPEITQQHVQSHNPSSSPSSADIKPDASSPSTHGCNRPSRGCWAPLTAIPAVPTKPLRRDAAARGHLLLERQVSAPSFGEAPRWVHMPHRSEGNCHLLL